MKPQHLLTLSLILAGSWWISAQTNTPKTFPTSLESWKAKSNSFGAKIAESCRIIQLPNGQYQPQFLVPKSSTNAGGWEPLLEGNEAFSDLTVAQWKIRRAFEVKKEVTDGLADAIGSAFDSLLPDKTNQLAPPTNLRANTNPPASDPHTTAEYVPARDGVPPKPVTKLQSLEAPKTNAPVFHVEQSGFDEASALFGAWAMARNPDVHDAKTIVEIARGLWQAQKRADALRQTNNPSK